VAQDPSKPVVQLHLDQWWHNREFVSHIPSACPDWIVTVCFYAALHVVDALLIADGRQIYRHTDRSTILKTNSRYLAIRRPYDVLYDLAHTTRYSAKPSEWVPHEQIPAEVFQRLYVIEHSVRKLLAAHKTSPASVREYAPIALKQ
jgi:hypothetical protein